MSEHALQVAVARMLQLVLDPEKTWWSAIDHGAGKLTKRAGGMMRARGVKRGLPDVIILGSMVAGIVGIELKTNKGRLTPDQLLVADRWLHLGQGAIYVARSLEEVQEILEHCRIPMRSRMNFLGGGYHERPGGAAAARHPRSRPAREKPEGALPLVLAGSPQKI